jgi:chromosome segregation ATPase
MIGSLAAAAEPGLWGQPVLLAVITTVGVLAGAIGSAYAAIRVKRMNRPVDDATAVRTNIEADKVRVDIHGREVEIARGLLDEIRKELDRVRADQERDRQAMERRLAEQAEISERRHQEIIEQAEKQHAELADQLDQVRAQQDAMRRRMDDHAPWDRAAAELLRQHDPDFPDPPPLRGH